MHLDDHYKELFHQYCHEHGLNLVRQFEGFYAEAYLCPAVVWTIGYGHTRGVGQEQVITREQAEAMLVQDLAEAAQAVERLISVPLSGNQFAALVSSTFNVGSYNLQETTLRRKLNAADYAEVPFELNRWNKATDPVSGEKRTLRGLVRRRACSVSTSTEPQPIIARSGSVSGAQDARSWPTREISRC